MCDIPDGAFHRILETATFLQVAYPLCTNTLFLQIKPPHDATMVTRKRLLMSWSLREHDFWIFLIDFGYQQLMFPQIGTLTGGVSNCTMKQHAGFNLTVRWVKLQYFNSLTIVHKQGNTRKTSHTFQHQPYLIYFGDLGIVICEGTEESSSIFCFSLCYYLHRLHTGKKEITGAR